MRPRNTTTRASAVVLFDIDGTLVRKAGPHHRHALEEAVRRVTGHTVSADRVPVAGMLDHRILTAMLLDAGASQSMIRREMPRMIRTAQSIYLRTCPRSLHAKVCPGVVRLLSQLNKRAIPTALVTGNFSRIGWRKIASAGLKPFFRFGAFAELAPDRAGLIRIALRRAESRGWIGPSTKLWMIGDHINDVIAARSNNIRCVSVNTGPCTRDELSAHSPDLLLDDLRSLKLEMLLQA
jgi:phosphoglycolate phosphatase-like HAD superfamily hydrolase